MEHTHYKLDLTAIIEPDGEVKRCAEWVCSCGVTYASVIGSRDAGSREERLWLDSKFDAHCR